MRIAKALSLGLMLCVALSAATTYDLRTDWNSATNPNGTWSYLQGSILLPHQTTGAPLSGFTADYYAPGTASGNFLPAWLKTNTSSGLLFSTGDILVHSVDAANGNPANGEATVSWTSPVTGTIDINFAIWYAHPNISRSNDFTLFLNSSPLVSGSVAFNLHANSASAFTFTDLGLTVNAGDKVSVRVARTAGQTFGSFADVGLNIKETAAATVPEPGAGVLFAGGLAALALLRKLRRS